MLPRFLVPVVLLGLLSQSVVTAQTGLSPSRLDLSRTAGLHLLDDTLWGVGDGYRVRFDQAGIEFMPALGSDAAAEHPTSFTLESIRRGDRLAAPTAGRPYPTFSGLRVEYDRGVAVERYDVGIDGIEQSFVFRELPTGIGDLVVRLRLLTDLQVKPHLGGLRVEQPGVGGFDIGGVTGIDGAGQRCTGNVRMTDSGLELSLPAAFIDSAVLPVTLDPFIGNIFRLASTAFDFRPRVSFDLATNNYLVVWQSSNSVHAHRVSRTGALVGTRLIIETIGRDAEVADVNDRDAFVVVYERNGDIFGRLVSGPGTVSTATTIAGLATEQEVTPTVGGSLGTSFSVQGAAICAWLNQTRTSIEAASLTVDPTRRPTITVGARRTPALGTTHPPLAPRLSRNDGALGRYALTYHRTDFPDRVYMSVMDRTGQLLAPELLLGPASSNPARFPDVDGDGTNWVVAWNRNDQSFTKVVYARGVAWSQAQGILFPTGPERRYPQNLGPSASVIRIGESQLLGSVTNTGAGIDSVDPFLCGICEGTSLPIVGAGGGGSTPFGCGTISGGGPQDEALIAGSDVGGVFAQLFQAVDGSVTFLGGGCGSAGQALATCARSPNQQFTHRLRNSIPNRPAAFVISGLQASFGCGGCTLVPDLAIAIVLSTSTDNGGDSVVPFSIPSNYSLRGVPLFEQWATLNLATPACALLSLDFSDALRVVIE